MDLTSRTVLVVGGTSGLGLALGQRLAEAGSTVVVGGRRRALLDRIAAESPALGTVTVDVTEPASIAAARDAVLAEHPDLDTVITMSGVMLPEDLRDPGHLATAERVIATNLLGTIRVATAFTPHLVSRGSGAIVTVSSGLGFVPFPLTPTYGATKAGVHSYTQSLREQLRDNGVEVVELVPPHVATTLMGMQDVPSAMPVADFTEEVVALLGQDPTPQEVLVGRVRPLRHAEVEGTLPELLAHNAGFLAMRDSAGSAA